ncbi:ABC transporter permease subunit [Azospirillum thermophilum]|uniref:Putrescine ABC transporter permease PotH n=1 Tax=Azospirillum thermophilum TaxID=2202148 RepID=A0A2S2CLK1_9PROT|nr:ABC transporter permease subunit [Azospirillum thermophilum]AWK85398.1 putrescine ABC transporter permease PotH [Azospirillum thermophilum]
MTKLAHLLHRVGLWGRGVVVAVPYLWLLLFFLVPFLIVFGISFSESIIAQPPYAPLFDWLRDEEAGTTKLQVLLNLTNYLRLLGDDLYLLAYLNSVRIALVTTLLCLLIGYPMAYAIAKADPARRGPLMMLVILPFWTSFLIRIYAWIGILKSNGVISNLLEWLGITAGPVEILYSDWAVYIGMTYCYLPFMVLPLYSTLEKMDPTLLEAAADLGCRPFKAFLTVTLPLSIPGIVAGSLLVFIPAVGEFVTPELLGGPDTLMIGRVLWNEFFANRDWPVASAVAIALLLFLVVPIMVFQHVQGKQAEADR